MFYVYIHLDPITLKVRYVGKGHDRRAYSFSHRKGHHKNWINCLKKQGLQPKVQIIEDNLSEKESLIKEVFWIKEYKSLGEKLTNLTEGGDGISGYKVSEDTKKKLALINKGKKQTPEQIAKMVATKIGKKRSPEACKAISKGRKGLKFSDEHKNKISSAHLGLKQTPEHIAKTIAKNTGQKRTLEQKANMQAAWVRRKSLKCEVA